MLMLFTSGPKPQPPKKSSVKTATNIFEAAQLPSGWHMPGEAPSRQPRESGQGIEDDDGLVCAGNKGFGNGDEFILLAENAEAGHGVRVSIELRGRAGRKFLAARLNLRNEHVEFGAVADFLFENWQDGSAGVIGEKILEGNEEGRKLPFPLGLEQFIERDGLIEGELTNGGAADFRKMRAAAKLLAHVVGKRTDVRAGRAFDGETSDRAFDSGEAIFEKFDRGGLEFDGLIFAREFVGGTAANFFGGENRGHLVETADGFVGELLELMLIERDGDFGSLCGAFGVVSVGGVTEAEAGGITLAAPGIEAYEARGLAKKKNENAGGKRVERAKMADLAESGKMADGIDDVVRGFAPRLVDDEGAVEGGRLWLAGHGQ